MQQFAQLHILIHSSFEISLSALVRVQHIDLPAKEPEKRKMSLFLNPLFGDLIPVSIALIVDLVRRALVRGPLDDPRLSLLALETQGALVPTKGSEVLAGLLRVFLPFAETARRDRVRAEPRLLNAGKDAGLKRRWVH